MVGALMGLIIAQKLDIVKIVYPDEEEDEAVELASSAQDKATGEFAINNDAEPNSDKQGEISTPFTAEDNNFQAVQPV